MMDSLEKIISFQQFIANFPIEVSEEVNAILWLVAAVLSLIPLTIFFISYFRVSSGKLLITAAAFCCFLIKATILSMKLFVQGYDDELWWSIAAILDIVTISLIAYSLSKKT